MTAVEYLIKIALNEEGYLEKKSNKDLDDKTANAGNNNWTKYARDLDESGCYNGKKNGYAWCDMFVDWCFRKAFGEKLMHEMTYQPHGFYGAGCTESAQYYKNAGHFVGPANTPMAGDQIFFTNDGGKTMYHTGIVIRVDGKTIHTIEGNTSSLPGVVENGGCVRCKQYSMSYSKIGGYGRPNWLKVPGDKWGIDEEGEIRMVEVELYRTILDVPEYYRTAVEKAMKKKSADGKTQILAGKAITGTGDVILDITEPEARCLTFMDRLGLLD